MIVIIDYGLGNLGSIANMFKKIGIPAVVSSEPSEISRGEKLVLPGVGAFDNGMKNLSERRLIPLLTEMVLKNKVPIIGLCLGMQLLGKGSDEGHLEGLGWLDTKAVRFRFDRDHAHLKIPHMGWNTFEICQPHPLVDNLGDDFRFYFVHSYHLACSRAETMIARTDYGGWFPAIVGKGNILGVQFHPEKSHKFGMELLMNYARL